MLSVKPTLSRRAPTAALAVLATLALLLPSCAPKAPQTSASPAAVAHTPAPVISGQWTLVSFGANWCPDCRRLAPELAYFPPEQPNVSYRHVDVDQRDSAEFKQYFHDYFKGRAIPFTVLIDSSGKARKQWIGYYPYNTLVGDILAVAAEPGKAE